MSTPPRRRRERPERSPRPERQGRAERPARERRRRTEDSGPIWGRPEPGERRSRYTREQIAATALEIADAEGFEAVSMRRLATELGAGTMTLYHYVRTKDELLALMDDAVMAEVLVPEGELPGHWRAALTEIAHRTQQSFARHPWAFDALTEVRVGPNGLMHFEQSLAAVADLALPIEQRLEIVTLVDDYVFGYMLRATGGGIQRPTEEQIAATTGYVAEQVASGDYPHVAEILEGRDLRGAWDMMSAILRDEGRFERGLERLLDGIEQELQGGG